MVVIKVGGNELNRSSFLTGLTQALLALTEPAVIVHGGGRGTSHLMTRLGIEPRFVEGLRVTDEQVLPLVVMGLVGEASVQLVNALVGSGLPALGLCGVDGGLVTAARIESHDGSLGAVGSPVAVDGERLLHLVQAGFLPCIAPVCRDRTGNLLNVNADAVAQAVAAAIQATALVALTDVPGVRLGGQVVPLIRPHEIEAGISSGEIVGGMIPKLRGALDALRAGVPRVVITNLEGLHALSRGEGAGTVVMP